MNQQKQINILLISSEYNINCGVSRYVYNLINGLSKDNKYNIHLIINGGDAVSGIPLPISKVKIMKYKKGVLNVFFFPLNVAQLINYCLKNDIHIIHTNHRYPEFIAWLVSKVLKVKTVSTLHSVVSKYRTISFRSEQLIAVSKFVRDYVINKYKVPSKKIILLWNAISDLKQPGNLDVSELKRKLNIPERKNVLLYVGRLTDEKGYDIIINAALKLVTEGEEITLLLIKDKKDSAMDKYIPYNENIKVIPSTANIGLLYSLTDIVIVPSRMESLSYVMLEAGYYKKLLIASKIGGIADFIDDNINGLLFPVGDINELVKKIKWALNHKEKCEIISSNLKLKVEKYCNQEKYLIEIKEVYRKIILQ